MASLAMAAAFSPLPRANLAPGWTGSSIAVRAQAKSPTEKKEKKKRSPPSSSFSSSSGRQRDFEDGMLIWDDVFEKCCEDPERAAALMSVAERGLREHGRGCVFVREIAKAVSKGAGTGFMGRSRPLDRSKKKKPAFYKSESWSVEYVPRKFIIDPKLAPSEEEGEEGKVIPDPKLSPSDEQPTLPTSSGSENSSSSSSSSQTTEDLPLVRRKDLMIVLRGMDRTRVLSLTSERLIKDSITARSVQKTSEEDEFDAGGEEPYMPSKQELVLLLHVDFDGMPSVGADVLQAHSTGDGRWKLQLRDFQLYQ
ncbi:uncharacterized protein LOC112342833 [Selaginella moellendorffii]|uniref:uncharacterized protein LOC112342833 n=1 Tax=Selaginella moellendorffii TaxID=88036 RepID=UPI000D1CE630|nr:uncharacterized protein LOC112342833 [Selaginella moellendorffii]|eukprot:XP_024521080.1 uncharacterized protein LOC112342833 [Selaginella moellendorffii]